MFDSHLRPLIDPPLNQIGKALAGLGLGANAVTLIGLGFGLMAAIMISVGLSHLALIPLLIGRLADGLDGAVARHRGKTDFGGYLDLFCDFSTCAEPYWKNCCRIRLTGVCTFSRL